MKRIATLSATAAALTLSGCVTMSDLHPLAETEWMLVAIDTSGSTTTLTPSLQERHTLSFGKDGQLALKLDCNRGRSTWAAGQPANGAGNISIGPVAGTRMACPAPSYGEQFATGLTEAERFTTTIDGRRLVLETPTLRFTFAPAK